METPARWDSVTNWQAERARSPFSGRVGTPGYCGVYGRESDARSEKYGDCTDCMKARGAAWRQRTVQQCQDRDARHELYRTHYETILAAARAVGVKTLDVQPRNTGFAYWLKANAKLTEAGAVIVTDGPETGTDETFASIGF